MAAIGDPYQAAFGQLTCPKHGSTLPIKLLLTPHQSHLFVCFP